MESFAHHNEGELAAALFSSRMWAADRGLTRQERAVAERRGRRIVREMQYRDALCCIHASTRQVREPGE